MVRRRIMKTGFVTAQRNCTSGVERVTEGVRRAGEKAEGQTPVERGKASHPGVRLRRLHATGAAFRAATPSELSSSRLNGFEFSNKQKEVKAPVKSRPEQSRPERG